MAIPRLTCPNCSTTLRPTKPVQPGKKVKCPECDTVFVAEDDPDETVRRPVPARKPAAKAAQPAEDEEEEGSYAFAKDDDKTEKPKIQYAPDTTIKDLRGPAQALVVGPANKLTLVGILGVMGYLAVILVLIILKCFPVKPDTSRPAPVMEIGTALGAVSQGGGPEFGGGGGGSGSGTKFEEERPSSIAIAGIDLTVLDWLFFALSLFVLFLFACVAALVAYGGIKINTLESRAWGIAGSIVAMIPITVGGVQMTVAMVLSFLMNIIDFDQATIGSTVWGSGVLIWLAAIAIGAWNLITLMNQVVVDGFEYKGQG